MRANPQYPDTPCIFVVHIEIFSSSPMQHIWSSLRQKIGNRWKLLLTAVRESFALNVTGLLDPTPIFKPIKYPIWFLHV